MQYTITLADGRKLTDLRKNGDNFVSETKVDETMFDGNLSIITVSNGEYEITNRNVELIQQVHYPDGWYLAFRELSDIEIKEMELNAKIEYIAMMAGVDMEV